MNTKFNIGDIVIYHHRDGVHKQQFKIDSIHITDKGVIYGGENYTYSGIREDELTKAPVTREEALAAALKDISKNISKSTTINLMEYTNFFEVCIKKWADGMYIGCSEIKYSYEEENNNDNTKV